MIMSYNLVKTTQCYKCLLLSSALGVCFYFLIFSAQAKDTGLNTGATTNGIFASGRCSPNYPGGGNLISVFIHFTPPNTNIATSPFINAPVIDGQTKWLLPTRKGAVRTNAPIAKVNVISQTNVPVKIFVNQTNVTATNRIAKYHWPFGGKFFAATNSFCGLIELRDASGDTIPLLKPEVNSSEAYPIAYRLDIVGHLLAKNIGLGPALPMVMYGSDAELSFYLKDYFKIKEPGEYQLTVWPKIYKRLGTNDDLCVRIDVPPVTIPIHWADESQH